MNIAKILKNAPKGTKLYSPIFGDVALNDVNEKYINAIAKNGVTWGFTSEGKLSTCSTSEDAECLLFPSKEQRDWTKFKIEPQFTTTCGGCCKVLGLDDDDSIYDYRSLELESLRVLLICRDAWWKMDNDWKPDWSDNTQDKHFITYYENRINRSSCNSFNHILAFRTAEIRDKFLETFGDLIEQCKELI